MDIIKLFELFGEISLKDEASKGLDGVEGKAEKAGSKFGKMGKAVAVGGAAVGAAAVGAGAALFGLATRAGDNADRILDLNAITGMSTDSIQEWQNAAKVAGVDTETMTRASEKLTKQMDILESGTGKQSEALAGLGMSYDDINNASPDERMDMVAKALAGVEDPAERARLGTDLLGGAWKDLAPIVSMGADGMDEAKAAAHDLGAVMSEDSLNDANNFRIGMENLKTMMGGFANQIGAAVAPILTDVLLPAFENMIPVIMSFGEKIVEWILKAIDVIQQISEKVREWVSNNEGQINNIKEQFQNFVDTVINLVTGFVELLIAIWQAWGPQITSVLESTWSVIKAVFKTAFDLIVDIFNVFAALFRGDWTGLWEAVKTLLSNAWTNIQNVLSAALDLLTSNIKLAYEVAKDLIGAALQWMWNKTKEIWANLVASVVSYLVNMVSNISEKMQAAKNWVQNKFEEARSAAAQKLANLVSAVIEKFTSVVTNVRNKMTEAKNKVSEIWESVKSLTSTALETVVRFVTTRFTRLVAAVREKMTDAKNKISEIWGQVQSFFDGINLYQTGKDVILGLVNGIGSMVNAAKNKAIEVAEGVVGAVKGIFKTASPSKVTTEIGTNVGEGLVIGMDGMIRKASQAAQSLANAAMPMPNVETSAARSLVQSAGSTMSNAQSNSSVRGSDRPIVLQTVLSDGTVIAEAAFESMNRLFGQASNADSFMKGVRG